MKSTSILTSLPLLAGLVLGLLAPAGAATVVTPFPGWSELTITATTQGSASADAEGHLDHPGLRRSYPGPQTRLARPRIAAEFVFKPLTGDGSVTTRLLGPAAIGDRGQDRRHDAGRRERRRLEDVMLQRSGAGLGGKSYLRAITGDRRGKDRKVTAPDLLPATPGTRASFRRASFPIWLKIERRGNGFTPYASTDGTFWIPVGRTQRIPMNAAISAGVFVSPGHDTALQSATFDGSVTDVSGKLLQPEEAAPLSRTRSWCRAETNR